MTHNQDVLIDQQALPDPTVDLDNPLHLPVTESFLDHAARTPNLVAVQYALATYSYAELASYAKHIARMLRYHGVNRGDVVGIYGRHGYDFVAGMLGTLLSGGVLLNLDAKLPVERRRTMIATSGCRIIVDATSGKPDERYALEHPTDGVISLSDHRTTLLHKDYPGAADCLGLPILAPDDPAYLFFTSGSTGTPKGVLGCHKGLSHFLAWQRSEFKVGQGDRCAHLTGLSFDVVLRDVFLPLTSGATLCIPDIVGNITGDFILPWMDRAKITRLHTVPSLASSWLAASPADVTLNTMRTVFSAGEPLTSALVTLWRERFPNSGEIVNLYGPTETTLAKFYYRLPHEISPGVQPVGWPIPETQGLVLSQSDELCGAGEAGEIVIRTSFGTLGYINAGPDDSKRFVPNPFRSDAADIIYRTGDRGRYRADGALEILGRLDQQIKIRGVRVEPEEVNAVLARHPDVRNCVVIARRDNDGSPNLVAYVEPRGASLDVNSLRRHLRAELLDAMIPRAFVQMGALPLTANGKIDRKALPAPDLRSEAPFVAPSGPVEAALAQIFAEVLDCECVGVHDNFFSLGGHSLLVAMLLSRIRKTFKCEIAFQTVFDAPTVCALASNLTSPDNSNQPDTESSIQPVCRDERLPLSFAQEGLWFLEQLEPDTAAYNIPLAFRLRGHLDVRILERSLASVIERHESLRTFFPLYDGKPIQKIDPSTSFKLQIHDARELELSSRSDCTLEWLSARARQVFDLAQGPLLRADLLWQGTQDSILLICVQHMVFDGWSLRVLASELARFYTAFVNQEQPSLPPLPIQYADYAAWHRNWMRGPVLDTQVDYWRRQLADAPVLNLPTDFARPSNPSYRGGLHKRILPSTLIEALRSFGRQESVTLFMVFLSAFAVVLARYSMQEEIVIGSPIAGRMRTELEDLIGLFINTLALRIDLSNNPTFRELLQRVRKTTLEAYAHQDVPFEKLVQALRPERDRSRNPFFQVMLNTLEGSESQIHLRSVEVSPIELPRNTSKFDLTLELTEAADGTLMLLEYATDLFSADTMGRLLGHLETLLREIISSPDVPITQLSILTESERYQVLTEWNETSADYRQTRCVHELFEEQVARTPGAIAVAYKDNILTYRALNDRSNQLAHYLQKHGLGPDVLVGLCVERSVEMVVGLLGILKAGGAYVPLDPTYPPERLAFMLNDASPSVLLTAERLRQPTRSASLKTIYLDTDWERIACESTKNPASTATADNLVYVIYTSGSTGKPKGAMIRHGGLTNYLNWAASAYNVASGSGSPLHSSLSFDLTVTSLFPALLTGSRVELLAEAEGVEALGHALSKHPDFSLVKITPAHLDLLSLTLPSEKAYGATGSFIIGGEALFGEQLSFWRENAPQTRLINEYGPTETVVGCCVYECGSSCELGSGGVPIGRPIANTRLYVLDGSLCPVPVGIPGELYIGGDGLGRGYLNRPDLTAERFVPDPFSVENGARLYKTGDLVRYRSDANLEYLGRLDHQVKIRGFRIELGEVESTLLGHAHVREAVVLARKDVRGSSRLIAYVVSAERAPTAGQLREHLLSKLPEYMVPSVFVFLQALPLTPNGKVDRNVLPTPDWSCPDLQKAYTAPTTSVEQALAEIWSKILRLDQVGIHDNFFELGGDSILSIQIISRANQAGLRLTPRQIFEHQTIASLAEVAGTQTVPKTNQRIMDGPTPMTPIQHWFFERTLPQAHHYNQARLVSLRQPVSTSNIERVCWSLVEHHDVLRMRFVHHEKMGWQQGYALKEECKFFSHVDLSSQSSYEHGAAITAVCMQLQSSLDLTEGPLLRVAYFDLGPDEPARLFLVIHHLVVDGVSWRVLLADLAEGLEQLRRGDSLALAPKTTSFQHWSKRLSEYAQSTELLNEQNYWLTEARSEVPCLPVDYPDGVNAIASQSILEVCLSETETRALLQEVPAVYHTRINDVLLSALAQTLGSWIGERVLLVDLEGHGREPLFDDVDVSRTVGWFTSQFPVLLELPSLPDIKEVLKAVKEQLRRVPRRGIGYGLLRYVCEDAEVRMRLAGMPQAQVSFNYHGHLHQVLDDSDLFDLGNESVGPEQSILGGRSHLLELIGVIRHNRLHVAWIFSEQLYQNSTVERLADRFLNSLREIIVHCQSPEAGGFTPSDFPKARVSQAALDRLVAGIRKG